MTARSGSDVLIPFDKQALGQFGRGETASTLMARDYKDASDLVVFNSRQECVVTHDITGPLDASGPQAQAVAVRERSKTGCADMSGILKVRRLTPVECERCQGFPDNYTRIPWRKKPAEHCPDGHRYRALGNSMAVNVMRWIGVRIEMVEDLM